MRTPVLFAFATLTVLACHGAAPASNVPAPTTATISARACSTSRGERDISGWQEIAATGFTFCAPNDWSLDGTKIRRDGAYVVWMAGERQTRTFTKTVGVPVASRSQGVGSSPLLLNGLDSENREFYEVIGGLRAHLTDSRMDMHYTVSAEWEIPQLMLIGQATDKETAQLELAILRTVRFTAP